MVARTLPGLGLTGYWDLGADGWKDAMDANLRVLSALVQCRVKSRTTDLPGSPVNGDIYIVKPDAGANANRIAMRDNGAWVYLVPASGYLAYVIDAAEYATFDGAAWVALGTGGGGGEGPATVTIVEKTASYTLVIGDAGKYVRMDVAAANTITVPAAASVAFPVGTQIPVRQVGAGQTTIVAASGVTINTAESLKLRKQHSTATLLKVDADEWDLTGDVELAP